VRPFVRDATPEWFAKAMRDFHPLRMQYWAISDKNPMLWPLSTYASMVRAQRRPRSDENHNVALEKLGSERIAAGLDFIATCAMRHRRQRSTRSTAT
jgi:hypothetical protein